MLTSLKLSGNAVTISAHFAKEEDNYFFQAGAEAAGLQPYVQVYGALCAFLGLQAGGVISQAAITNLLRGRDATGNKQVAREHKVMAIDLVFSAPKSVSIAGLLTERDPRIVEAHDRGVTETMREIEARCAATRKDVLSGSRREPRSVQTGNLAYVTVRNGFNRDHDPHLHTHVVVMNMTEYQGQILALDGHQIMRFGFNKAWGAAYRAKLAAGLKELGYSISDVRNGMWRLDAVSPELELEFSGRRARIEKVKANDVLDMTAWRVTRKKKDPGLGKQDVLAGWRERLARHQPNTAVLDRAEIVRENP